MELRSAERTIVNNVAVSHGNAGLSLLGGFDNTITQVISNSNNYYGLAISGQNSVVHSILATGNRQIGGGGAGIDFYDGTKNTIVESAAVGNTSGIKVTLDPQFLDEKIYDISIFGGEYDFVGQNLGTIQFSGFAHVGSVNGCSGAEANLAEDLACTAEDSGVTSTISSMGSLFSVGSPGTELEFAL